jgi:ATP-dependent phosphoenolpyruvate carboxykinase
MGKKGDSGMLTAGPRRRRPRKSKPKAKRVRSSKRADALWSKNNHNNQALRTEEVDRLLVSALRYWEAKRDFIEERIAAIRAATAS